MKLPQGTPLINLSASKAGVTDDDKRFGALAYGIVKQTTL